MTGRLTIAIDFDGPIHAYSRGWQNGEIYDDPSPGTKDALIRLGKRYDLVVFTARHDIMAVEDWLTANGLLHFFKSVTNRKPMAYAYIDDRGIHWTNWEQTLQEVL